MIKNIIRRLFFKIISTHDIISRYHQDHSRNQRKNCIISNSSKIIFPGEVFNFRNDRQAISIGDNSISKGQLLVFANGGILEIGKDCFSGETRYRWSAEKIKIGNGVLISHNVNIIDTNSHELDADERIKSYQLLLKKGHPSEPNNVQKKEIIIEDKVWINFNSIILKGVVLGEGCIVAAGSIVTHDVKPYSIVAGVPAKEIVNK
ncbi:MAG: acyltransferase [Fulvivirga sp.]|uniref:acyltransferase n=1 Tax=Fulvivirga sp. TaxID=1931237 RepID=UPI0032F091F8